MDALRNTISTQSIKTKQIVFQYPDGSFPADGAILNITDDRGHTDWTRAPNLDSITLVDASGNEGVVSYTVVSSLLVNNIPVGGGGGAGSGGTNIAVTGLGVINFDPTKGGGVDMSGAPMTRLQELQFDGSANILFGSVTGLHYGEGTKVLTVNPISGPPPVNLVPATQGLTVNGIIKAPYLSTTLTPNAMVVGYNTTTKEFEVQPAGGGGGAPTAGTNISVAGTQVNFDPSGGVDMLLNDISGAGSVSISDGAETARLDISGTNLLLSSSTGAGFKIGVPLVDVSSNTAGTAGQVLTSDGSGNPPYWAGPGGGSTAKFVDISAGTRTFDLSGSGLYKVDYTLTGGGGSGGSGSQLINIGGGGGGASGHIETGTIYAPGGTSINYTIGAGGFISSFGDGTDGSDSTIIYYNYSKTAAGGGRGFSNGFTLFKGGDGYYGGGAGGYSSDISGGTGVIANGVDNIGPFGGSSPGGGQGGTPGSLSGYGGGGGGGFGGGNGGSVSDDGSVSNGANGSYIGAGGGGGAALPPVGESQGGSGAAGGLVLLYTLIG